jgi:hypothetical protein
LEIGKLVDDIDIQSHVSPCLFRNSFSTIESPKNGQSDSFATHFAQHCKKEVKPTSNELRKMMKVKIIWRGAKCDKLHEIIWEIELLLSLCMRERRIEILRTICQEEWKIL